VARFFDLVPTGSGGVLDPRQEQYLLQELGPLVRPLVPLLQDPRRVVRAQTGRVLARMPSQLLAIMLNNAQREQFNQAVDEYIVSLRLSGERGGAHMELGLLYESLGRLDKAEEAYRDALEVEPLLAGPRTNLAALFDRRIELAAAHGSEEPRVEQWRTEAERLRAEEFQLLERDVKLMPDSAGLQYRYGLALHLQGRSEEAEAALRRAVDLEPSNDQSLYALARFYEHYQRYDEALECLERLVQLRPDYAPYEQVRQEVLQQARGQ
jgi:tetratricopeptide (TPR) repeat protein